jgi:Uma2 family endonuclease
MTFRRLIMAQALKKEEPFYTYYDYEGFTDDERYELIDGVAYAMAPAPTPAHQSISSYLHYALYDFLSDKPCDVFASPIDVRLDAKDEDDKSDGTVLQPDLIVVCDKKQIGEKAIIGAPALVIEILSPSNSLSEMDRKFEKYMESGVLEYWVVSPDEKSINLFMLQDRKFASYRGSDELASQVLQGFTLKLDDLFA